MMSRYLPWLVVLLIAVVLLVVRSASRAESTSGAVEAHRLVAEEGAVLLDVRTPSEFAAGHVEGAVNIPVDEIAARAGELGSPDRPVVVYCRSGGRSAAATATLKRLGFTRLEDLGAMSNW